jgi:hypothetical protein
MAERLLLTAPIVVPQITQTGWDIYSLYLGRIELRIIIVLVGDNGERRTELIEGATADGLLKALNVANLSIKSLYRRVMEWLIANRGYPAAVSGTPDA